MENMAPQQIKDAVERIRQENQNNTINKVNETEKPPRESENLTAKETVDFDAKTNKLKDKILRKIFQIKFTNIEDRGRLSKIRTDKCGEKLIETVKIAVKEIISEFKEMLETTIETINTVAYEITEKRNGKPKNYMSKIMHKRPRLK